MPCDILFIGLAAEVGLESMPECVAMVVCWVTTCDNDTERVSALAGEANVTTTSVWWCLNEWGFGILALVTRLDWCLQVGVLEAKIDRFRGRLAQWLERLLHTQEVSGSNPLLPTMPPWQSAQALRDAVSGGGGWVTLGPCSRSAFGVRLASWQLATVVHN
jgi:hypothetical protein